MELKDLRKLSGLNECGMSPMPSAPPTPASISMTAASGNELSGMLKDIMSLAGLQKVEPGHLGVEPPPMKLLPEPVKAIGPAASDGEVMRGISDKLNLDKDDEEMKADEAWDNAPADAEPKEPFDAEEYAHHENPPGAAKGRNFKNNPVANVEDIAERLFAEYQNFLAESEEVEEAKDEEVEEEKSWFDMDSKERQAHFYKKGGGRPQPGHSAAPAKTSSAGIKRDAADTKAALAKQDYKGKEDDFS